MKCSQAQREFFISLVLVSLISLAHTEHVCEHVLLAGNRQRLFRIQVSAADWMKQLDMCDQSDGVCHQSWAQSEKMKRHRCCPGSLDPLTVGSGKCLVLTPRWVT